MKMGKVELNLCRLDKRTNNCVVMLLRPSTQRQETVGKLLLGAREIKKYFHLLSIALCLFYPFVGPVYVGLLCVHAELPVETYDLWWMGSRREEQGVCLEDRRQRGDSKFCLEVWGEFHGPVDHSHG